MLRHAFGAAAIGWAAAVPAAAYAAARPHAGHLWYAFALAVYAIGSGICHQLPARSFHLGAASLPVCARCTGIYAGAALAAIAAAFPQSARVPATSTLPRRRLWIVLACAAAPAAATLVFEWTTGITPSNGVRAASGLLVGAAVGWVVIH